MGVRRSPILMPINIWINLEIKAKKRGTIDEQYEDEEKLHPSEKVSMPQSWF